MAQEQAINRIVELLSRSNNTVVVTGAGISTEAGIPDFRGEKGIYRTLGERYVLGILNIDTFRREPDTFYEFYRQYFMFPPVEPSPAHFMLAKMEKMGLIKAVVTQNIDNLHQKAGNKRVVAVHGNAERFICTGCGTRFKSQYVVEFPELIPTCDKCEQILKPDVVLFGEHIQNYLDARDLITGAKLLVVIGSSLTVYPLAGFVKEFSTFYQDLVIINKGPTQLDHAAAVKLNTDSTGEVLEEIVRRVELHRR